MQGLKFSDLFCAFLSQAAQALDVNKLLNSDTVTQRTIYRDCMGNLPLC